MLSKQIKPIEVSLFFLSVFPSLFLSFSSFLLSFSLPLVQTKKVGADISAKKQLLEPITGIYETMSRDDALMLRRGSINGFLKAINPLVDAAALKYDGNRRF